MTSNSDTHRRKQIRPTRGTQFVESRFLNVSDASSTNCALFHSPPINPINNSKPPITFLEGFYTNTLPLPPLPPPPPPPPPQPTTFDLVRLSDHLISNILHRQLASSFIEEGIATPTSTTAEDPEIWDLKKRSREDVKLQPYAFKDGVELFNCPLCSTADITTRAELTSHLQQHQNNQRREDGKHVCCFCASELSSNSSLERHLLTHTNHRPFACSLCDKAFTTNGNLSRHRRTSHQLNNSPASTEFPSTASDSRMNNNPHAIQNLLEKNRTPIPCFRAMLHAIKRKNKAFMDVGKKLWQPQSRLRDLLIKRRRRFLRYIRLLREQRLNTCMEEALDLSIKHEPSPTAPPPLLPPSLPPPPRTLQPPPAAPPLSEIMTTPMIGLDGISSLFQLMMMKTTVFAPCSLTSPPLQPPPSTFTSSATLPKIMISSVINRKKNSYKDAPKLITCPVDGCNQKFPWNSSLKRHILTHTPHKPFSCTRCTKSFSTKSNRERHMERVHRVSLKRQRATGTSSSALPTVGSESGAAVVENTGAEEYLRDEEIASMRGNDRQAEDISNSLLRSAGSPLVEPNPERLALRSRPQPPPLHPVGGEAGQSDGGVMVMICPVCGRTFGQAQSLRRHLKTHLHKQQRRLRKKLKRQYIRRKNAQLREANSRPEEITEEEAARIRAEEELEKQRHDEEERQWLERERVAQEIFAQKALEEAEKRRRLLEEAAEIQKEKGAETESQANGTIKCDFLQRLRDGVEEISDNLPPYHRPEPPVDYSFAPPIEPALNTKELCGFFWKTGACIYGDRCSRFHPIPPIDSADLKALQSSFYPPCLVLVLENMFDNFSLRYDPLEVDESQLQSDYELFYEDVRPELEVTCGGVSALRCCRNAADHLRGNVYVQLTGGTAMAIEAATRLNGRWYAGRQITTRLAYLGGGWKAAVCELHTRGAEIRIQKVIDEKGEDLPCLIVIQGEDIDTSIRNTIIKENGVDADRGPAQDHPPHPS
ncbi:U2 small nuclear ribonucleoprotein auxiliary factor 35 kDa subunit-related protein 2 [Taenia crassiceps]|uniref:U2 small nuclear ribonucleoprotein auxiliary factor 35 kDa subunit-related protein 2 n=1 Tax=Taenia crassiceps TaxID=6207 RepID=A0ABR4Q2K2_9CEST